MAAGNNRVYSIATIVISLLLIIAGLIIAFLVVTLRFKDRPILGEDILLGVTALLFVGAGLALISLANGLQARLTSEAAKMRHENDKPSEEVQILKYKLLDAIGDRLSSISINSTAALSTTNTTVTLNPTFKDRHDNEFTPEKDILGLKWKSDHEEFAKVDDNGVVTFVAAGAAKITVTFRSTTSNPCQVTAT
ncbi:MAG TPA: Ig-like domain-containing protein [Pyrinomonadaceae bacterium]|nr:Ig-like domain-containing protein [Pyrinomonadaceae bacterium]